MQGGTSPHLLARTPFLPTSWWIGNESTHQAVSKHIQVWRTPEWEPQRRQASEVNLCATEKPCTFPQILTFLRRLPPLLDCLQKRYACMRHLLSSKGVSNRLPSLVEYADMSNRFDASPSLELAAPLVPGRGSTARETTPNLDCLCSRC